MNECAQQDLNRVEGEMKKNRDKLHQLFKGYSVKSLYGFEVQAQGKWHEYVELHCSSVRDVYQGGSLARFVFLKCKENMTQERIQTLTIGYGELRSIVEHGHP